MTFHKILCPVDFSPGSHHAMRAAVRIAEAHNAELVLANVWYLPSFSYAADTPVPSDAIQLMLDDSERGLDRAAHDAAVLGARRVSTRLVTGVPWDQLIVLLRSDEGFDLVVMGTHGRTGLARILLGSVTEQVVRHAPCPVLTVRDHGEPGVFRHVLCPVDFSDSSRRALDLAAGLISPGGAGIELFHVVDLPVAYSGDPLQPAFIEHIDRQAASSLQRWAAELGARVSVPITTRSWVGRPGAQILAALDRDPSFDLVVTGSHGRTGLRRLVLGSVAEQVIRHASRPVLVARSRT